VIVNERYTYTVYIYTYGIHVQYIYIYGMYIPWYTVYTVVYGAYRLALLVLRGLLFAR
jgi:hypothetical protein